MNKILAFFWVIIISGTVFISINFFKPDTETGEPKTIPKVETINEVVVEEKPAVSAKDNKSFQEYIEAGDSNLAGGYIKEAIENYQKAGNLNPSSSDALVRLGEAELKNNQPDKAREALNAAAKLNPESIYIKVAIARSHLNLREIDAAKNIIWSLDANNYQVKYYKAILLILYKEFEEANKLFTELKTEGVPPEIIQKSERFLAAFTTFSYYIESDQVFLEVLLAKALTEAEEYEAAIPLLFEILNQKNNYRDAWIILGYAYLNTDKAADAVDAFKQAETLESNKPQTLFFLGLAYFANNEIDKAIHYIEKADENGYEPKDQINLKLGDLYFLKEEYNKSAHKYENVISINPKNIDIFVRAVYINIEKRNDAEKALKLAMKALENHPNNEMSYNLVGWAYTAAGDYKKAEEYLKIALSMNPRFDAATLNFGWLSEQQGQSTLAKEYYKKAYILGKNNSIADLAAKRFNRLTEHELQQYYQVDISAPVYR